MHVPKEKRSRLDKNEVKCIFIGYKDGMKGYKIWDPASRKKMYIREVVFREFRRRSEVEEIVQTKNNLEKVRFEMWNEEDNSHELIESEEKVEQPNPVVRRS